MGKLRVGLSERIEWEDRMEGLSGRIKREN